MVTDWIETTLREICEPVSLTYDFSGKPDVIFLNTGDILDGDFLHNNLSSVEGLPGQAKKTIQFDDILFSEIRPKNKRFALVGFKDTSRHVVSTKLMVIRAKQDVLPKYLYLLLTSKATLDYFQVLAESRSGTFPQITFDAISHHKVKLPPLPVQERIAEIVGSLDDKIELNRRMNETLEGIARALFKSWFVDFDPVKAKAEGRDPKLPKEIADLFPDSFEESELGPIPEEWETGTLNDVAKNARRGVKPNEISGDTPYIGLQDMPRKSIALDSWGKAENVASGKFQFKEGEFLFGKLRPYFHKVVVAPLDGVCSTDILVVIPKTSDWSGFVIGHISSLQFVDYTTTTSTGTRMPRTNWKDMSKYKIVVPSTEVAILFSHHMNAIVAKIQNNIMENKALAKLRDTLLPKLLSGELQVPDGNKTL